MKKSLLFISCFIFINCKVQKHPIVPADNTETNTPYISEGKEFKISQLPDSEIRVNTNIVKNNFTLSIEIVNLSQHNIDFDPMNIKVLGVDNFDFKGKMKIIEPEKYLRNIEKTEIANGSLTAVYSLMALLSNDTNSALTYQLLASSNTSNVTTYGKLKIASQLLKKQSIFEKEKIAGLVLVKVDSGIEKYYGFNGIYGLKFVQLEIPLGNDIHTFNIPI